MMFVSFRRLKRCVGFSARLVKYSTSLFLKLSGIGGFEGAAFVGVAYKYAWFTIQADPFSLVKSPSVNVDKKKSIN